jgi:hypothetical protein
LFSTCRTSQPVKDLKKWMTWLFIIGVCWRSVLKSVILALLKNSLLILMCYRNLIIAIYGAIILVLPLANLSICLINTFKNFFLSYLVSLFKFFVPLFNFL